MERAFAAGGLIAFVSGVVLGQAPAFDVASVRRTGPSGVRASVEFLPGGKRFIATGTPLGQLIVMAYGITPLQVSPIDAIISEKYDVQAETGQPVTRTEMLLMLRTLLADRFRLSVHREMRELPAYALVIDKRGAKLRLSKEQLPWTLARARGNEQKSGRMFFENESMPDLAYALSTLVVVGRVVIDQTGLLGNYDFELNFAPPDGRADAPMNQQSLPSIFTAVREQLGLKLEPLKAPVEFLVIDHVERPTDN
jgi:uncharacterized protein (TIGR03435 family)